MWPFCSSSTDRSKTYQPQPASTTDDEALARSLQEQQDAEVAQMLARAGSGNFSLPPQQKVVSMQCGICGSSAQVQVPLSAQPGSTIQAACPRCTADNSFTVPSSSPFPNGFALPGPGGLSAPPLMQEDGINEELLHVACEMGNRAVEMMVDTGAQTSVISMPLVRTLGLESRLDSRYQGMAAGVGTARILGKLRGVPVQIGHVEFALDFSVLGVDQPLLLLGIDQMRRFKCVVNLEKECLIFGGADGVEVPFLPPDNRRRISFRQSGCAPM
eukprot:CAMPEP_0114637700 /NCGR_PEP_ID=MMETSP0191-20121206/234_1 /TAXON_ID=126664 /ORGANISM="Sorites sp." /LENGTH=271 /DNA_ID=CAMNT_0001849433 /DNA_START=21 /DNA_END=836 /DNA_ORIENTATION=-